MTVRLGVNPIGWSNDDLRDLGGETPLETCLAEARSAGFAGIELGHKFPRDAATLGPILVRHQLALVSGWYSCELLERDSAAEMNAMRPHLTLLRALGCDILIVAETSNAIHGDRGTRLSHRPVLAEQRWPVFTNRLTELADAVAGEGLSIAYHHHMGTIVQSEAEIDRLMAMTGPNLTLLLDTGHATFAGADPIALARRHCPRITHVHCKDVRDTVMARARREDLSFLDSVVDGVFTVPGDGMVDFPGVLSEMSGYRGWLVVEAEQNPAKAHPLTYARMGHDNLADFVRLAGLVE
jgi:inosose dehydratase